MTSGKRTKANGPRLSLSVQYASSATLLPTRVQLRRWVKAALGHDAEITLRLVDETEGRALNKAYRRKDYPTNVLTFVYHDNGAPLQGDLVLCAPVVQHEAEAQGKDLAAHYAHLVIHGILHLQGYEHDNDEEAAEMERLETAIMAKLGYADPYAVTSN